MEKQWIFQVLLLPAIGLTRRELLRQAIILLLEEVKRIIRMLGLALWGVYQLHRAPAVQVVVLTIVAIQALLDLLLQRRDDKFFRFFYMKW